MANRNIENDYEQTLTAVNVITMTDRQIVEGLINRDSRITQDFFFTSCRPMFCAIIKHVYNYDVDYDEFVNELYLYLMQDDATKLRAFGFRSSLHHWLDIVATRYFIKKRDNLIDNSSHEYLNMAENDVLICKQPTYAEEDLQRLLGRMPSKRYAYVIQRLILEEWEPQRLALEMNVSVPNLYNIKSRAIAQLIRVAVKDTQEYGK